MFGYHPGPTHERTKPRMTMSTLVWLHKLAKDALEVPVAWPK